MAALRFKDLSADDLLELQAWFADGELRRRLSYPSAEWFAAVSAEGQENLLASDETGRAVATIQVEPAGDTTYIAVAVRPELRRRGIGAAVTAAFLAGPGRRYAVVEGRIESDNPASLACMEKCGFRLLDEDEDGLIRAVWLNPARRR